MTADVRDDNLTTTASDDTGSGRLSAARDRVRESAQSARERASDAYASARERTNAIYGNARGKADDVRRRASDEIGSNPLAAVIGGLAVGAIVAAILPKTRAEAKMLKDVGVKLNDSARGAAKNATDAGRAKLDELGYNTVKEKLGEFVGGKKN